MVSTVWSVYCLLFFYSRCPPCPAICKSGGHVPPMPHGVGATGCEYSIQCIQRAFKPKFDFFRNMTSGDTLIIITRTDWIISKTVHIGLRFLEYKQNWLLKRFLAFSRTLPWSDVDVSPWLDSRWSLETLACVFCFCTPDVIMVCRVECGSATCRRDRN